jgi:hypothetical protein
MSTAKNHAGNLLGDLAAERDHIMLDAAFYRTPDYLTLVESNAKAVVVGRRGTGKSALAYCLAKYWHDAPKTRIVEVALEEDQVIGLGPLIKRFGASYKFISVGCKIAWRYCLAMEVATQLSLHFKFEKADDTGLLARHLKTWRSYGSAAPARLRRLLDSMVSGKDEPERLIADLAINLELTAVERALNACQEAMDMQAIVLLDRLDEGYEPTDVGVGFVDGIVSASVEFNARHDRIRVLLFLRDNMFRTVAKRNDDYSRSIEGQVLRLHWNEYHLMSMVCQRLRVAREITDEESNKVWNKCVATELKGKEGFKKCLQLTLYRPRDILVLLNEAFHHAGKEDRQEIILDDVRAAGKTVSGHRLADLHKEYSAIIPGLELLTEAFVNGRPEFTTSTAEDRLRDVMASPAHANELVREFAILGEPIEVLRKLFSIGFVGIRNDATSSTDFCHDGTSLDREIRSGDTLLIHPCYWMALNLDQDPLSPSQAEEIHDEYDKRPGADRYAIAVAETTSIQRAKKLNELMAQLGRIPEGGPGEHEFENWCHRVISTVFATSLSNVEFQQASGAEGRREIVAANLARTDSWTKLGDVYGVQQALFLIYNRSGLGQSDYQQAGQVASGQHTKVVFVVTRDDKVELTKDAELPWVRDIAQSSRRIVIRLTAKFLALLVGKLRNPQKHDAVEKSFGGLLEIYAANYLKGLAGQIASESDDAAGSVETTQINLPRAECFGELITDDRGRFLLKVFANRPGPGMHAELCEPIQIRNQAQHILQSGLVEARRRYIESRYEQSRADGRTIDRSECEPPVEQTFEITWTPDQLATIIHSRKRFGDLSKADKNSIKQAMHRLRSLVKFTHDDCGLVSEPSDTGLRCVAIPLRFGRQGGA